MHVQVRALTGQAAALNCTTLEELRQSILTTFNIPLNAQRIVYSGEELKGDGDKPLSNWGIHDGCTVRLVAHLTPFHTPPQSPAPSPSPSPLPSPLPSPSSHDLPSPSTTYHPPPQLFSSSIGATPSASLPPISSSSSPSLPPSSSLSSSFDIKSLTPNVGPSSGGTRVTIAGEYEDFGAFACYFGALEVRVLRVRTHELCVCAPAHPPGVVTVCVANLRDRSVSNHLPYIYTDPQANTADIAVPVASCSPTTVPTVCREIAITQLGSIAK